MDWHPLCKHVKKVKDLFYQIIDEKDERVIDFRVWLQKINDYYSDENGIINDKEIFNLLKIFEPLDITSYKNYALFKYKGYIELGQLGYGLDFFELYDGLYRECRSIVFDLDDCSVALASIRKFKNFDEDKGDWSISNIYLKYNNANEITFTNKMDGSYQQYRWDSKNNQIIGSGSQALNPQESWRLEKGLKLLKNNGYIPLLKFYPNCTFCFEFVSPDNPIVVKYDKKDEGLYLFAVRNNLNGLEWDYNSFKTKADNFGVKCVESYETSLNEVLNNVDNYRSDEKEGWVISLWTDEDSDVPFRVKIKTTDYVLMHHALAKNISPNAIIKAFNDEKWDDFRSKIPVAYMDYADNIIKDVVFYLTEIKLAVNVYLFRLKSQVKDYSDNKECMIWINENVVPFMRGYVRNKYLDKENYYLNKSNRKNFGLFSIGEIREKTKIVKDILDNLLN